MRLLLLLTVFTTVGLFTAQAQTVGEKTVQKAKDKVATKADTKTDEVIDKGIESIENGIKGLFKKKKKTETSTADSKESSKASSVIPTEKEATVSNASNNIAAYSKYDFIAGEKVLYATDFDRVDVGDFPADWNSNASGEIVKVDNKTEKWLSLNKNGSYIPEAIKKLDDNFTLEFDAGLIGNPSNNYSGFGINFNTEVDKLMEIQFAKGSYLYLHPGAAEASFKIDAINGTSIIENSVSMANWNDNNNRFAHISIWRQKGRLRLYVNDNKLLDLPRFFAETQPYSFAFFRNFFNDCQLLVANIKYAIGAPDTRNKLLTEGKFSTTGILFDVNSDQIKSESFGVLKEIATVLKENEAIDIKIVGHTDSDGDDAKNLQLSIKRAEAVKKMLATTFEIASTRLSTDGRGETMPVDSNTTAQGKANNRRVEFIKL